MMMMNERLYGREVRREDRWRNESDDGESMNSRASDGDDE